MEIIKLVLLIFLGTISYFIVKKSVVGITTTPVWLLWLVLMIPPFFLGLLMLLFGETPPLPLPFTLIPFIISPMLYWWLIQKGRISKKSEQNPATQLEKQNPKATITQTSDNSLSNLYQSLTPEEESSLRNCFPWGVFYLQNLDYRPQAILCRGRLKSNSEEAYKTVRKNVESKFGDRFLLVFQEGAPNRPFFALVPNPRWKKQHQVERNETEKRQAPSEKLHRPLFALSLLIITLFSTTLIGVELSGAPIELLEQKPELLLQGLPYSLGLISILGVHEFCHYSAATYYSIRTTLPYFIPIPFFLGTFGAFINIRGPIPHRKALFDIALAGPVGGFLLTMPILIGGLSLSKVVSISEESSILNFDSLDPRFSLLMALMGKMVLGAELTANKAIDLHPLAIAGYVGIIVTALNLMPVGNLDGGHLVHAMLGQRRAILIGQITRLIMLLFTFQHREFIIWALILFLIPNIDEPALNDVTELDNYRDGLGLLALALLLIILLPIPKVLANLLKI